LLRFAVGLSYAEIAEHMDITNRTVDQAAPPGDAAPAPVDVGGGPPKRAGHPRAPRAGSPPADARELGISAQTVNDHAESACRHLGVRGRAAAIALIGEST
jgi:DNA-binding CsgD family transcriptional regulator